MTLTIEHEQNVSAIKENADIHFMPCKINHDGPASVSGFFLPYVEKTSDNVYEASFRGYPLQGQQIDLPKGSTGLVIQEMKKPLSEDSQKHALVTKTFTSFKYWNWDFPPSKDDQIQQAMDWITLSKVIHDDV
nr:EOG090X0IC1 [Cyclestheria hislopi]